MYCCAIRGLFELPLLFSSLLSMLVTSIDLPVQWHLAPSWLFYCHLNLLSCVLYILYHDFPLILTCLMCQSMSSTRLYKQSLKFHDIVCGAAVIVQSDSLCVCLVNAGCR
jgi:hypothetical protein